MILLYLIRTTPHQTKRTVREIMDAYSFDGFYGGDASSNEISNLSVELRRQDDNEDDTKRSASTESKSTSSTTESKGSTSSSGSIVVLTCLNLNLLPSSFLNNLIKHGVHLKVNSQAEEIKNLLESYKIEVRSTCVVPVKNTLITSSSSLTIWENPKETTSSSLIRLMNPTQTLEISDTIRPDALRCRQTVLQVEDLHNNIHVFTNPSLAKQFAPRHVPNRQDVTLLLNLPYGALFMEQGFTASFSQVHVHTIDANAIARIFDVSVAQVLEEAVKIITSSSSSSSSELHLYIKENGLIELNIPSSKIKSLPSLPPMDESNTFRETPFTRSNLDLRPKKQARLLSSTEFSSACVGDLINVATTSRNLFTIKKNVRMTSPLYGRDLAHVELVHTTRDVSYKPGHILRVKPRNAYEKVDVFLREMGWNGDDLVVFSSSNRVLTVREHASTILELFASPKSSFLKRLGDIVNKSNKASKRQLEFLANNIDLVKDQGLTYASVLVAMRSIPGDYASLVDAQLVPEIADRSYSIASCSDVVRISSSRFDCCQRDMEYV